MLNAAPAPFATRRSPRCTHKPILRRAWLVFARPHRANSMAAFNQRVKAVYLHAPALQLHHYGKRCHHSATGLSRPLSVE
jgi:hypothetical protein